METWHPVECYFCNEFRSVCNYCGVMAAWSGKTLKICRFLRLLEKRPLTGKVSKFCSERIHRLTGRHGVHISWNLADSKSVKSSVLPDKQKKQHLASFSSLQISLNRAQILPLSVPDNVLRVLQTSSKLVHFRRTREHRQSALQSEA